MNHLLNYQDWINESLTEWKLVTENDNEGWGEWISHSLHLVGDIAGGIADMVVPGSGAIIDAINAIAYFIEAEIEQDYNRKTLLMISGVIQIGSIFLFGALQTVAISLKEGLKWLFKAMATRALVLAGTRARAIVSGIKSIIAGFSDIIAAVSKYIGPGSKFAAVTAWICEKTGLTNAVKWFNDYLVNKVQPVLKNFLEKIVVIIPENLKKIIIGPGNHEAEEFVVKNIAKVLAGKTAMFETHHYLVSQMKIENDKWLAQYQAKQALAVPTSGVTPVPAPTSQPNVNFALPPLLSTPTYGR